MHVMMSRNRKIRLERAERSGHVLFMRATWETRVRETTATGGALPVLKNKKMTSPRNVLYKNQLEKESRMEYSIFSPFMHI